MPSALVRERAGQLTTLIEQSGMPPDAATMLALRYVHDSIHQANEETGWLLDMPVHGRPS